MLEKADQLKREVQTLDSEMQMLVYENYAKVEMPMKWPLEPRMLIFFPPACLVHQRHRYDSGHVPQRKGHGGESELLFHSLPVVLIEPIPSRTG